MTSGPSQKYHPNFCIRSRQSSSLLGARGAAAGGDAAVVVAVLDDPATADDPIAADGPTAVDDADDPPVLLPARVWVGLGPDAASPPCPGPADPAGRLVAGAALPDEPLPKVWAAGSEGLLAGSILRAIARLNCASEKVRLHLRIGDPTFIVIHLDGGARIP